MQFKVHQCTPFSRDGWVRYGLLQSQRWEDMTGIERGDLCVDAVNDDLVPFDWNGRFPVVKRSYADPKRSEYHQRVIEVSTTESQMEILEKVSASAAAEREENNEGRGVIPYTGGCRHIVLGGRASSAVQKDQST